MFFFSVCEYQFFSCTHDIPVNYMMQVGSEYHDCTIEMLLSVGTFCTTQNKFVRSAIGYSL